MKMYTVIMSVCCVVVNARNYIVYAPQDIIKVGIRNAPSDTILQSVETLRSQGDDVPPKKLANVEDLEKALNDLALKLSTTSCPHQSLLKEPLDKKLMMSSNLKYKTSNPTLDKILGLIQGENKLNNKNVAPKGGEEPLKWMKIKIPKQ